MSDNDQPDYFLSPNRETIALPAGTPVANHPSGNGIVRAVSPTYPCVGLLVQDAATESKALLQVIGPYTMSDWSNIIGAAQLAPNTVYYLSATAGRLTALPPPSAQIIGTSLSPLSLQIEIMADARDAANAASLTVGLMLMGG